VSATNNIFAEEWRDQDTNGDALLASQKLSDGSHALSVSEAAANAAAITPSDSTPLANITRAIYVGVSGDIKVDMAGSGTAIVLKSVAAGLLQIRVAKVYSTGTAATNLVALY
jgi:hypothetical protein